MNPTYLPTLPGSSPAVVEARDTLNAFLVRVQGRGWLTPLQADVIRRDWGGNAVDEIVAIHIPLPPSESVGKMPPEVLQLAAFELLALSRLKPDTKPELREALEIIAAWRLRQLLDLHEQSQDRYEARVLILATRLDSGQITLRAWQRLMLAAVLGLLAAQALLGTGGSPQVDELAELDRIAERETAYLARFADDIALGRLQGKPMSAKQIAARAALYAGTARGQFYRGIERRPRMWPRTDEAEQQASQEWGWVAEYVARDDDSTCDPCHEAQGWYLPAEGPMPGQACLGRARCRCRRVLRYLPQKYLDLVNLGVAA